MKEIERLTRHYLRESKRLERQAQAVFDAERRTEKNHEEVVALALNILRDLPMPPADKEALVRSALAAQNRAGPD